MRAGGGNQDSPVAGEGCIEGTVGIESRRGDGETVDVGTACLAGGDNLPVRTDDNIKHFGQLLKIALRPEIGGGMATFGKGGVQRAIAVVAGEMDDIVAGV